MKPRDITIKVVLNGWIVIVGCQTILFTDLVLLTQEIGTYLLDPEDRERHYLETAVNSRFFPQTEAEEQPALAGHDTTSEIRDQPHR